MPVLDNGPLQGFTPDEENEDVQITYRDAAKLLASGHGKRRSAIFAVSVEIEPRRNDLPVLHASGLAIPGDFFAMFEAPMLYGQPWNAGGAVRVEGRTVEYDREKHYRDDRSLSWLLIAVSVLLLLVTANGIVGMASLRVTQRRRQIGVRRVLGARRIDILRYFVTENLMITGAGVAGGVLLAVGLNELLVSRLELTRLPPVYLAAGASIFWLLGVIAVYGLAWRAASISPASATRNA